MDHHTEPRAVHVNHSARRINHIIRHLGSKDYLEVGVAGGSTFFSVEAQRKVAVDTEFRFNIDDYASAHVAFYACTSDTYFLEYAQSECFDVIFLDGLHTFEQTFRDFCNSLTHSHSSTVWLIDDILPNDVYSSIRNHREAVQFRKNAGKEGNAWHGDTFKTIFAIHDFFPTLSYCCVGSPGNPQALVWRQSREEFNPILDSLEAISRLSYFDLQKNLDILKLLPEEQAMSYMLDKMLV